ncbi:hypothetical protein SeMB42_g06339 [Synchytrium endobioticum]|uniref:Uncharacterized protein n=1 Tax=Synchytrium endobioticum TaxID=286115 RepID=A0A507CXQ3_9FUNG|nr:hypothetical protein SeMB42_g06339 [Synchytrium endobioticum]TPX43905.1 hypothetical protein SeLEV6574_g04812 [Synchytrium endobioticum]
MLDYKSNLGQIRKKTITSTTVSPPATPKVAKAPPPKPRRLVEEDDDDELCMVCDGECTCNGKTIIVTPIIEVETDTLQMTAIGSPQAISPLRRASPKTPRGSRAPIVRGSPATPRSRRNGSTPKRGCEKRMLSESTHDILVVRKDGDSSKFSPEISVADLVSAMISAPSATSTASAKNKKKTSTKKGKTSSSSTLSSAPATSSSLSSNNVTMNNQPNPAVAALLAALAQTSASQSVAGDVTTANEGSSNSNVSNTTSMSPIPNNAPSSTNSTDTLDGIIAGVQAALQTSPMSSVLATFAAIANATGNPGLIAALGTVGEMMASGVPLDSPDTSNGDNPSANAPTHISSSRSPSSTSTDTLTSTATVNLPTVTRPDIDLAPDLISTSSSSSTSTGETPLKLDEFLDTEGLVSDASDNIASNDTPLSPVAVAIARWKTVPIGSFRRSRRASAAHGRTSAAVLASAVRSAASQSPTLGSTLGMNATLSTVPSPGLGPVLPCMRINGNNSGFKMNNSNYNFENLPPPSAALGGLLNASPLFAPLGHTVCSSSADVLMGGEDDHLLMFDPPPLALPEGMIELGSGPPSPLPLSPPPSQPTTPHGKGNGRTVLFS